MASGGSMTNGHVHLAGNHLAVRLVLTDGCSWTIVARDERAFALVSRLSEAMNLPLLTDLPTQFIADGGGIQSMDSDLQLIVAVDRSQQIKTIQLAVDKNTVTCIFGPAHSENLLILQLMRLSVVISMYTEIRGGMLLHGALAKRDGCGVILAGPGGAGKTTASEKLAFPWQSLSDDSTLVICDQNEVYWAHPWPTWSDFMFGGNGGTWDVQLAVPLKGIFFLEKAQEENFEPLGIAQSACLLIESVGQTSKPLSNLMKKEELRMINLKRFENICNMAQAVPSFVLRFGVNGHFWREIERALNG